MREIIITLFLIIGAAIAEEAGIGEAIKPAEEAGIGKAIKPAEEAGIGEAIKPAEEAGVGEAIKPAEEAGIGEAIKPAEEAGVGKDVNPMSNRQAEEGYESARFKKFVTHCSSHVAETCSGSESLHDEGGEWGLARCLFDSMESCLVDHGASLYETTPANKNLFKPTQVTLPTPIRSASTSKQQREYPKSTRYLPFLIETVKFRTALKTCTHVTAQACFTPPNVAASLLPTCLAPFLNQCLYPTANSLPMGPSS